ncbi:MAG: hypothetical protein EOO13_11235 [Chitinophagaceae bacterium]|nr:MAG: hypothetical protein EOO13_11235 [Chitinophagaceae bacterium]
MKLLITLGLLVAISFSAAAQQPGCRSIQTGKFKVTTEYGTTLVTRTRDTQTEEDAQQGVVMIFDLKWINECTYTLRPKKVIKGDPSLMNKDMVLTVVVKEVNKNYYIAETAFNLSPAIMTFKVDIVP